MESGLQQGPNLVPLNRPASRNAGRIWVLLWDKSLADAKPAPAEPAERPGRAQNTGSGKPARWQTQPVGESVRELVCLLCFPFTTAEPSKSQTRKPKCGKGTHCSRNAYMLVYRLQTREKSLTVEVPGKGALTLLAFPSLLMMLRDSQESGLCSKHLLLPGRFKGTIWQLGVTTWVICRKTLQFPQHLKSY